MSPHERRLTGLLAGLAWLVVAGTCGGGSGDGGSKPTVKVETPDERCMALPGQFPPGFDFVPGVPGRVLAVNFAPGLTVPVDVDPQPPEAAVPGPFVDLRSEIATDGCAGRTDPALDGVQVIDADLALVTASACESLVAFDPATGALGDLVFEMPASGAPSFPFGPAPGTSRQGVAFSTRACVLPPPPALDSFGAPIPPQCDASAPSYFSNFTSGVALVGDVLMVSSSNLGSGVGTMNTQYLPGSVLVFQLDRATDPPTVRPDPAVPVIFTSGFNPTHLTPFTTPGGRRLVLVSVSGAAGLAPDDPATPEREAGGVARTPSAIDVVDVDERRLIASVPLGLAALSFERLGIDPTGRVALGGSFIARHVLGIDLAPVDALAAGAPYVVLDGSSGPDAVIFDADHPFELPALASGPPEAVCPGFVVSVDWSANGTQALAIDFCDGTVTTIGVDLSGDPPPPVPGTADRFDVTATLEVVAPLTADALGLARAPGALRVRPGRPGIDYQGPDVLFVVGEPEGALCGLRIDSL